MFHGDWRHAPSHVPEEDGTLFIKKKKKEGKKVTERIPHQLR